MITKADEAVLRRLVRPATLARARLYSYTDAIVSCRWSGDNDVSGVVQGSASQPYEAEATLVRSPSGRLQGIHMACSCPVGIDCKHAVALLLAPRSGPRTPPVGSRSRERRAAWEVALEGLLDSGGATASPDGPDLGLQFELVREAPANGRTRRQRGPAIRVRPVVQSPTGRWVRTGVSWSAVDRGWYGQGYQERTSERVAVARELLVLSRLSSPTSAYRYSSGDEAVWLDSFASRRVWDLLRQATDVGVPLLRAGRSGLPVVMEGAPAQVVVDMADPDPGAGDGTGMEIRARIEAGGRVVSLEAAVLVGSPAHGVAWWPNGPASGSETPELHLAALDTPVASGVQALLAGPAVQVPDADRERFWRSAYPALRRVVAVRSGDGSVDLPEVAEPVLVGGVRFEEGNRTELSWWRGEVGGSWREPLSGDGRDDGPGMAETVAVAARVVEGIAGTVAWTPFGVRLAPTALLEGMASVRFATEILPLLQELDGIEVEVIGEAPDFHEVMADPVVSLRSADAGSGASDWFDLSVVVTVGGEEVEFQELFVALAEERTHLVLPSGAWFSLEREELRQLAALIGEARQLGEGSGDRVRVSRFQAGLWDDLRQAGVDTAQAAAWESSVRGLVEATNGDHPIPAGLRAELRPYQVSGFQWLVFLHEHGLGGILADDMGLGKTLQALALVCHVREQGGDAPFLVVAPTSVVGNWLAECERFAPGLVAVAVTETEARRGTTLAEVAKGATLVVTSYALFRLEHDDYLGIEWAGLLLDEAQFAKNAASQAYQRARLLPVACKVAITGTPMENNLMELWALLSITAPGLFPRSERFATEYRAPIERHADRACLDRLRRRIRPLMLRRTKEQVAADLPDKQEQVLELELDARHARVYQRYLNRERQKVLGLLGDVDAHRFEIFRSLTLLRQASLDVSLVDPTQASVPSTKLDVLVPMLAEVVADGHRVLVFSQFTRYLSIARARLDAAGIGYSYLDGKTRRRAAVIDEFRSGATPVFLISLKAGGFGLNLAEADYCILLDPWWNPATEAQAVDRAHRIGQTRKVMVYRMVAAATIEEKVMALKAKKAALFSDVVGDGAFESVALSADDIRTLLA